MFAPFKEYIDEMRLSNLIRAREIIEKGDFGYQELNELLLEPVVVRPGGQRRAITISALQEPQIKQLLAEVQKRSDSPLIIGLLQSILKKDKLELSNEATPRSMR